MHTTKLIAAAGAAAIVAVLVTVAFRGSAESPGRTNPPPTDTNCYPVGTNVVCSPEPAPQFLSVTESNQCVAGAMIVALATYTNIPGLVTTTITYSNGACPPLVTNATVYSAILTNWWDAGCANGSGLAAAFSPTNCGGGTINFYITYSNAPPCSNHTTIQTNIAWNCDCDCRHHILNPSPLTPPTPPGITSCGQSSGQWVGTNVILLCAGNTAQLTCGSCSAINPNVQGAYCMNFLINGASAGHCLYEPSLISDYSYYKCMCGAVIMKSHWEVTEGSPPLFGPGPGCGYSITWTCEGGLSSPQCYDAQGTDRACNSNGTWDW
jgi:hypothetical protein